MVEMSRADLMSVYDALVKSEPKSRYSDENTRAEYEKDGINHKNAIRTIRDKLTEEYAYAKAGVQPPVELHQGETAGGGSSGSS